MSHSIQCPHCQTVLKSSTPVPAGKKVKCPKCKESFTTKDEGPLTHVEKITELDAPPPAPPPSTLDDDDGMAAAIAKLEAEQGGGKKAPESKPATAPSAPASNPAPGAGGVDDDDEMAAAIAKLEAEQGKKAAPASPPAPIPKMEIPEVDDDDLVASDEKPAPAKKAPAKVVEKPRAKKASRADEDEEDEPRPKKKRRDEEDDDDEPRSKKKSRKEEDDDEDDEKPRAKKKRRDDDEDEDDEPPSAKKKRRDVDDDDEDDEPRPKKKQREDDDDDDEDDRSTARPKKKSGVLLWVLLGVGGVLGLFACCGCGGIGVYYLNPGDQNLVGTWQKEGRTPNHPVFVENKVIWEFSEDGTGYRESHLLGQQRIEFKYKIEEGSPRIFVLTYPPIMMKIGGKQLVMGQERHERYEFSISHDELTLRPQNIMEGGKEVLRRVK